MCADAHVVCELHRALKNATHIDAHILPHKQIAAQIKARSIHDAHTLLHQAIGRTLLVGALQLLELHRAVHPGHLQAIARLQRNAARAIQGGHLHDVRQVILTLAVVVRQLTEPSFELSRGSGHHAAVPLLNIALCGRGIFVLHNGLHRIALANDAPIARRIAILHGEQGQLLACAGPRQIQQGLHLDQRHIAIQDQGHSLMAQLWHRLLHGMPRSQLRLLQHIF